MSNEALSCRSLRTVVLFTAACFAAAAGGCGSDDVSAPLGSAGASQDAGDADVAADTADEEPQDAASAIPLTVVVVRRDPFSLVVTTSTVEGVTVAADLPGGERVEAITDANGRVSFGDVDWAKGSATVTAYSEGYVPSTLFGISASDHDIPLSLYPNAPASPIVVTGTAANMADPAVNALIVSSSLVANYSQEIGAGFAVPVRPEEPFTLVATEWKGGYPWCMTCPADEIVGWTRVDHGPISAPTTVDLDFANALTPTKLTVTYELPTDPGNTLHDANIAFLNVLAGELFVGFHTKSARVADGSAFVVNAEYLPWDGDEPVMSTYELLVNGRSASKIMVDGYPKDGDVILGFLPQPMVTRPADPSVPVSLAEPIEWTIPEQVDVASLLVLTPSGTWISWAAWDLTGSGSIQLPPLPSNADPEAVLGSGPRNALLTVMQGDYRTEHFSKRSFADDFKLTL